MVGSFDTLLRDFIQKHQRRKTGGGDLPVFDCEKRQSIPCRTVQRYVEHNDIDTIILQRLRQSKKSGYTDSLLDLPQGVIPKLLSDASLSEYDAKMMETYLYMFCITSLSSGVLSMNTSESLLQSDSVTFDFITLVGLTSKSLDWKQGHQDDKVGKDCRRLLITYMNYFDKKLTSRSGHNIRKLLAFLMEVSIILYALANWQTSDNILSVKRRFSDVLSEYDAFHDLSITKMAEDILDDSVGKPATDISTAATKVFNVVRVHILLIWAVLSAVQSTCQSLTKTYQFGFQDIDDSSKRRIRLGKGRAAAYPVYLITENDLSSELMLFRVLVITDKSDNLFLVPLTICPLSYNDKKSKVSSSSFVVFDKISKSLTALIENASDFRIQMDLHTKLPYLPNVQQTISWFTDTE